jgi:hypothetical protein
MDILVALKQEEAKWEKQAEEARQQLETVRAAIKLFRGEAFPESMAEGERAASAV